MPKTALALQPKLKTKPVPVVTTAPKVIALLEERLTVAAKFSQLEAKKKQLDADIAKEILTRTKRADGVLDTPEYVVTGVASSNSHVSREQLLKLGVKASLVEKATKVTNYVYVRIDKKKTVESLTDAL